MAEGTVDIVTDADTSRLSDPDSVCDADMLGLCVKVGLGEEEPDGVSDW